MEKIGCPPRTPPSRKSLLYIFLFYPLIQVYTDNKVIDKDKYPYNLLYSKNTKNKADIKNKNNGVLGKGERERENRFYKIGFPLAKTKKVNAQKEREGENRFYKKRFPSRRKKVNTKRIKRFPSRINKLLKK